MKSAVAPSAIPTITWMKYSFYGPKSSGMRLRVVTDSMSPAESPINASLVLWLVALMKNTSAAPKLVLMPVTTISRIT